MMLKPTKPQSDHQSKPSKIKATAMELNGAELTGSSGPALPHPDLLHLVADLGQAELHLGQLEVEGELLVLVTLLGLLQGSRGLLVTLSKRSLGVMC